MDIPLNALESGTSCTCGDHVLCESSTGEIFKASELLVRIIILGPWLARDEKKETIKCFLEALIDRYQGKTNAF